MIQLNRAEVFAAVRRVLSHKFFPFVTAVVTVGCYYLGWDLVTIWYMALCGIAVVLLLDDVTPIVSLFLFMNIMISRQNSPSCTVGGSQFYFQPAVVIQIGILIGVYAAAVVYKTVQAIVKKRFRPTPAFGGFVLLACAMLLNGLLSARYTPMNAVYGLFLAFCFLGIFVFGSGNTKITGETFVNVAWAFVIFSFALVLELVVAYFQPGVIDGETINRGLLMFGWGVYNTLGMLILLCIPFTVYLAGKYKFGWLFTGWFFILLIAAVMSMSRQAMIGAIFAFVSCVICLIVNGRNRKINIAVCVAVLILVAAVLFSKREIVDNVTDMLFGNFLDGSGRAGIWKSGFREFLSHPIFGTGFYNVPLSDDIDTVGLDIIPLMYHNTFIQLLASGGVVAFCAYIVHRVHTVISYVKNPSAERTYLVLAIACMLITNLFDNHLFYILPTLVYSMLIVLLIKSEKA